MPEPDRRAVEYTADDIRVITLVEAICLRPRMYTAGGTPAEIAAYLEGWFSGLVWGSRRTESRDWDNFLYWLRERLSAGERESWYDAWRRVAPDDSTANGHLAGLYAEFRALSPTEQARANPLNRAAPTANPPSG